MSIQEKTTQLMNLAEQVARELGFQLVDARLSQQGRNRTVEITIYRQDRRIGLDDCEEVSRRLEAILDQQSPPLFDGPFLLEVQSPGIDRTLKTEQEMRIFSGNTVEVKAREVIPELGDVFTGTLKGVDRGCILIEKPRTVIRSKKSKLQSAHTLPPDEIELELTKIFSVRLHPETQLKQLNNSEDHHLD